MQTLPFDSHLVRPARCADRRRHSPITSAQCVIFLVLTRPHDLQSLLSKTLLLCVLILGSWSDWHVRFMSFDKTKGWCGITWGKFLFVRLKWTRLYNMYRSLSVLHFRVALIPFLCLFFWSNRIYGRTINKNDLQHGAPSSRNIFLANALRSQLRLGSPLKSGKLKNIC